MKILLITGGNSSERTVSLNSARNVKKALIENGHKVAFYDLRDGYEGIKKISKDFDILFPVLHGEEGEGGKLHKFLSTIKKPIVGTRNYKGLKAIWYKIPFKEYCNKMGIPTSKWKKIKNERDIIKFSFPCVVKTSSGGSSLEVFILKLEKDFEKNKKKILKYKDLFAEKYIKGVEITIGVLNKKALKALEIIPPDGEWFSYKNKYSNRTREIPDAPSVNQKIRKRAQEISLKIHNDFNLGTYSRTDFIVDEKGNLFALEINTIPGLTEGSLIPKEANSEGFSFGDFLEILLTNAK